MSVAIAPPPPVSLPGLGDALSVFRALVDNPVETGRALDAMKAVQDRYDQQLKTYGTIQEIERLRADAEAQSEEAGRALTAARREGEQIVVDAKAVTDEAHKFRDAVTEAAEKAAKADKAQKKAIADAEKELERQKAEFAAEMEKGRDEAKAREESLAVREGRVAEREAAATAAIDKLNSLGVKVG